MLTRRRKPPDRAPRVYRMLDTRMVSHWLLCFAVGLRSRGIGHHGASKIRVYKGSFARIDNDEAAVAAEVEAASDVSDREAGRIQTTIEEEVRQALVAAGYSPRVARAAVASASPHVGDCATLVQLIRAALRAALDCR